MLVSGILDQRDGSLERSVVKFGLHANVRNANVAGIVSGRGRETLDLLLSNTYCRSQQYLSRQLSQLHPQLTMPVFSGKHYL
jgi:hypothetical protein